MLLSDRRIVLLGLAALAGCGFTPVYGPEGDAKGLAGAIEIDAPRDAAGQALVAQLEDRLGIASAAEYRLAADVFLTENELGITPDQVITRYQLLGQARFVLYDLSTGTPVTSGTVSNFSSYSATGTPFATQTAQNDAQDRLMVILADEIVARLLATAGNWR